MTSMLAIGVLCDNQAVFNQALDYFYKGDMNGNIQNALWYIHPDGLAQGEEAGRDQGHNNGGLNFLSRFCQVALNQNIDLFAYDNNRVLRGLEYLAKYNLFNDVGYVPHRTCDMTYDETVVSEAGRGNLDPMFELLFNHYVNLKGMSAPYCKQVADMQRPEPGPNTGIHPSQVDWFGFGSLTYTRDPFPGDMPPSGVTVNVSGQQALVNWWGSAYATNYVVKRAAESGGLFTVIAPNVTGLAFTNSGLANGTIYYFVVAATNAVGESADADEVPARPVSTTAPQLSFGPGGGQIQINWPSDHTGWRLETQTNSRASGLGTNWFTVFGSGGTNQVFIPIDALSGTVFFRLVYP